MILPILAAALALNTAVTPATIHQTVCVPGYSQSIRPPVSYTTRIKRKLVPRGERLSTYELDHWIPISLGGHPSDPRNLVLQPWPEAREKDRLERQLYRAVCAGRISLRDAQLRMEAWEPVSTTPTTEAGR